LAFGLERIHVAQAVFERKQHVGNIVIMIDRDSSFEAG